MLVGKVAMGRGRSRNPCRRKAPSVPAATVKWGRFSATVGSLWLSRESTAPILSIAVLVLALAVLASIVLR